MDNNSKLAIAMKAIKWSVRSLVSSFSGLFKMNRKRMESSVTSSFGRIKSNPTDGGPINHLPNEVMLLILVKLQLDDDVVQLIRLRLVSTRWRALIEYYCAHKKCLLVQSPAYYSNFESRFFAFGHSKKHFVQLLLSRMTPVCCLRSLLRLFPNIEQLSINCFGKARVCDFVEYINSLSSLKQLDLEGPFVSALPLLSPLTLSKLEHFSIDTRGWNEHVDAHHGLVSQLGPWCVCVHFGADLTFHLVRQWHNINPHWLVNVTHLRIHFRNGHIDGPLVVHYLTEHCQTSLKHLNLKFCHHPFGLVLTPTVIRDLGKLTHLAELELVIVGIDFAKLKQAAQDDELISLTSVVTCTIVGTIYDRIDQHITAHELTRVLSVIFPNLVEFELSIRDKTQSIQRVQHEVEQHLYNRFAHLRKHNIDIFD